MLPAMGMTFVEFMSIFWIQLEYHDETYMVRKSGDMAAPLTPLRQQEVPLPALLVFDVSPTHGDDCAVYCGNSLGCNATLRTTLLLWSRTYKAVVVPKPAAHCGTRVGSSVNCAVAYAVVTAAHVLQQRGTPAVPAAREHDPQ